MSVIIFCLHLRISIIHTIKNWVLFNQINKEIYLDKFVFDVYIISFFEYKACVLLLVILKIDEMNINWNYFLNVNLSFVSCMCVILMFKNKDTYWTLYYV